MDRPSCSSTAIRSTAPSGRDQIDALGGHRRIAPDLRGMGESDAPDLGYGMTIYAADFAALLDTLGVDDVVLCGLSMGGYVIFEFLRRWREPGARADAGRHAGRSGRHRGTAGPRCGRGHRPGRAAPQPSPSRCFQRCCPRPRWNASRKRWSACAGSWRPLRSPAWSARLAAMRDRPIARAFCLRWLACRPWSSSARMTL